MSKELIYPIADPVFFSMSFRTFKELTGIDVATTEGMLQFLTTAGKNGWTAEVCDITGAVSVYSLLSAGLCHVKRSADESFIAFIEPIDLTTLNRRQLA